MSLAHTFVLKTPKRVLQRTTKTQIHNCLEILTYEPANYTKDHPGLNFIIFLEKSIVLHGFRFLKQDLILEPNAVLRCSIGISR